MKYAGAVLALTLGTLFSTAIAQPQPDPTARQKENKSPAEATTAAKLSPSVSEKLNAELPKYNPAAADSEKTPAATALGTAPVGTLDAPTDPEMLHLKKVTVTPRKRPRLGNDVMMTSKAYNDMLAKEKLSSLDRNVLNKFTLPSWFGGVSAAERAREERDREQRTQMANDVFGLAKVVEVTDPAQAKVLRDAMNRP